MNHNLGHRQRMRERFLNAKIGTFPDYEVLETILSYAIPRKDTKPLAKELLVKFKSFSKVLNAEKENLLSVKGVGENVLACFRAILESTYHLSKEEIYNKPLLTSWQNLLDYSRFLIGKSSKENFMVFYLNNQNELIDEDLFDYGTVDEISIYPREITKRALFINATALILAHNHPGGSCKASKADIEVTNNLIKALNNFNIRLHDHIILTEKKYFSFKEEGLI